MTAADTPASEEPQAPTTQQTSTIGNSRRRSSTNSLAGSRRSSFARRGSALFAAARASFVRTRGQSGASVEQLRGTSGSKYEGYANIHRGDGDFDAFNIFSLCCGNKSELYFVLIKGFHCFVFENEDSKSPKYAIELINRKAVIQPSHDTIIPRVPHPGAAHDTGYTTVHLESSLGDVEYKFTVANMENTASEFCNAVAVASNDASTEQVRKRLGHENLLSKRASMKFANAVGTAKAKDQPDAPVGAAEVMAGMPATGPGPGGY
mmetsp:Transcript_32742/g.55822  ORF Transcript_32742/g.55822 Transcript_32742/m.55822 type:complete len:264 (+) Transcript_32742:143-934(+)